jgi:putative ABC transport system permease protein
MLGDAAAAGVPLRQWLSLRLALRHLLANRRRLAATILAVAAGVALVVAVYIMNAAVLRSFLDTIDGLGGRAGLTVTTAEGFPFPEATLEAIAGKPGVRLAAPLVRGVASPDDGSGQVLTVIGVDLANETAVRIYHDAQRSEEVVGDLLAFLSQPDSIVATRQWAVERGVAVGDRVPLVTPAGLRTFTVRGLVEPQRLARALGGRLLVMDMYAAQQAFGEKGFINQIDVLLDDGADPAAVKAAIEAALPAGLVVREPATRRDGVVSAIRGFQAMLLVFALLAALAGIVICYSRLRSLFEARLFDIGLFRSIGLPQSVVFAELLKESMLLGAAGILVGLPAGALIARWAFPFMAQATALNFRLPVATSTPVVTPGALLLGVAVGLLAAILAAVVPAWRLASTQPVAALRLRGRSLPRVDARARLVAAGAIAAAAVVSAVVQQTTHLPELGILTTGFFIVSALTLAGPLVVHGARVLRRVHGAIFGPAGHLASAALHHQSTRATLAVATLAIGLGAVLFFGVLGRSFERSVVAQLGARFRADVVVSSAFASDGWVTAPLREEVVDEVRAIPGVTMVAAQHVRDVDVGGTTASIFAYDAACFRETRLCKWPLLSGAEPDAMESVATGQGALASVSVARELGVKVGDPITLDSPTGPRRFRLVGIAREEPAKAIIMCRDAYRASWNDRAVTWIHAALDDPQDAGPMMAAIARRLGTHHRVQVQSMAAYLDYLAGQVRLAFSGLYIMEAITFLLVLLGIADTVAAGVLERTRQFGMMRAVGLTRARLCQLVLIEGASLGLLGTLLAVVVGLALSLFWIDVQLPALLGWNPAFELPGTFIATGAALSLLLALVAAFGPALRAARLPVPAALQEE